MGPSYRPPCVAECSLVSGRILCKTLEGLYLSTPRNAHDHAQRASPRMNQCCAPRCMIFRRWLHPRPRCQGPKIDSVPFNFLMAMAVGVSWQCDGWVRPRPLAATAVAGCAGIPVSAWRSMARRSVARRGMVVVRAVHGCLHGAGEVSLTVARGK